MIRKKTKRLFIRVSEEQYQLIKKRSIPFKSITSFVIAALNEFSDSSAKDRIEQRIRLTEIYLKLDEKMAHVGGNLNQAMHRINESAKIGRPYDVLIYTEILPRINELYDLCNELRVQVGKATKKAVKY